MHVSCPLFAEKTILACPMSRSEITAKYIGHVLNVADFGIFMRK